MIDIQEIHAILPHRYPFLLVDRVLSFEPGKKIVGLKNVTINEPFFQGHFPGHPIMPGVLIIESMAQIGGLLAYKSAKGKEGQLVYFLGIDKAKFRRPVLPGDQLHITVEVLRQRPPYWKLKAMAYVEDQLVSEAELKAMLDKKEEGEQTK